MTAPFMKSALILVDLQNDFLPGGALAVPHGDEVIPLADELQRRFDLVVATKDWHPSDHGSFAANHKGKKPGDRIILDGIEQILWPVHCVQNTHGAEFSQLFDTSRIAHVFHKGTERNIDSYSTFSTTPIDDTPVLLIIWRSDRSRRSTLWVWRWTIASNTVRSMPANSG